MSLDPVFTAFGVCHTEILKWVKLLVCVCVCVCMCVYIYVHTHTYTHTHTHTLSLNYKTYVVSKIVCYITSLNMVKVFQKMQ